MQQIIKEREDIIVARSGGVDSCITKEAKTPAGELELTNEWRMLHHLRDTGYVPRVFHPTGLNPTGIVHSMTMWDAGDSVAIRDEYAFRTELIRMLWTFRSRGVIHGDLTSANIRIIDDKPIAIDWGEGHFVGDGIADKRPEGDTFHAWSFATQMDGARIARRWLAIHEEARFHFAQPITMLDIGCYHGDIAAAASAAGWDVDAVDVNHSAIEVCRARFDGLPARFLTGDAIKSRRPLNYEVITMLSMFPYLVQDYGRADATEYLETVIKHCGVLFFETQLYGDGPGVEWLPDNATVQSFLEGCGGEDVRPVVEIEIPDRQTTRTVFKVTGRGFNE